MEKILTKKELLEIFPEARDYLEEELTLQLEKFELLKQIYKNQLDIFDLKVKTKKLPEENKWFGFMQADIFIGEDIKECERRIKEIYQYVRKEKPGEINDSDIESAKNYPFENLIKTNKAGFAPCPFHKEKTPSFYIKKNFGYCFGCGKQVDTIQFLMETEGLSFIQAVKILK